MSSSQSFWTAVQSPLRQNSIIQECKHLSCLLFASVINLSLLYIFVYYIFIDRKCECFEDSPSEKSV